MEWLKGIDPDRKKLYVTRATVCLIALLSFALGYLYAGEAAIAPIIIEKCSGE